jgi:cytochrome b561
MELIDPLMKWIVAPLVGMVIWMLKKITSMSTEMRVLEAKLEAQAEASKNAHEALQQQMTQVLSKLNDIESYLRKDR